MITKFEQYLYNTYLYVSRTERGKPFSPRKDFSDMDPKKENHLRRIANLLTRYPHIDPKIYFKAAYEIYADQEFFELSYFSGMGAVNAYTLFMKKMRELPPDDDHQIERLKESLKFIAKFCYDNKITLKEYITFQTGVTYDWMKHLKRHQISVYALMEFPQVYDTIVSVPEDERELLLGDCGKYFLGYKSKYLKSKKAQHLVSEAIKKIDKIIGTSR